MPKIIGLTGGIGSGKSTIAKFFSELGVPVYVADTQAKKIMDYPSTIQEVQSIFGEKVLDENQKLDRKKIASIVFNHPEKLKALNSVIHPKVAEDFSQWLNQHNHHAYVIKEVAIIFETHSEDQYDKIILVTAPEEIRIQRVMERDKISKEQVEERIKNQLSDQEKINKSDFIIMNIDLETSKNEIKKLHKILISL